MPDPQDVRDLAVHFKQDQMTLCDEAMASDRPVRTRCNVKRFARLELSEGLLDRSERLGGRTRPQFVPMMRECGAGPRAPPGSVESRLFSFGRGVFGLVFSDPSSELGERVIAGDPAVPLRLGARRAEAGCDGFLLRLHGRQRLSGERINAGRAASGDLGFGPGFQIGGVCGCIHAEVSHIHPAASPPAPSACLGSVEIKLKTSVSRAIEQARQIAPAIYSANNADFIGIVDPIHDQVGPDHEPRPPGAQVVALRADKGIIREREDHTLEGRVPFVGCGAASDGPRRR